MEAITFTIEPLSAFGTPLAGDTLFGHVCWAVRERCGEQRLRECLAGYTSGTPFAVISDGFPAGFLPKPALPDSIAGIAVDPRARKALRARRWLPTELSDRPLREWLTAAAEAHESERELVTQNTIDRLTGTTGTGQFAPRQVERLVYAREWRLEIHAVVDVERFSRDEMAEILDDIGAAGYGKDASAGTGKFRVLATRAAPWTPRVARHYLSLAPCAPVPDQLRADCCFYQPLTRFGRHGNLAAQTGQPFKRPVLMMKSGAVLTLREEKPALFHGSGLGGVDAPVSAVIPETVYQGYAPLVPLNLDIAV